MAAERSGANILRWEVNIDSAIQRIELEFVSAYDGTRLRINGQHEASVPDRNTRLLGFRTIRFSIGSHSCEIAFVHARRLTHSYELRVDGQSQGIRERKQNALALLPWLAPFATLATRGVNEEKALKEIVAGAKVGLVFAALQMALGIGLQFLAPNADNAGLRALGIELIPSSILLAAVSGWLWRRKSRIAGILFAAIFVLSIADVFLLSEPALIISRLFFAGFGLSVAKETFDWHRLREQREVPD